MSKDKKNFDEELNVEENTLEENTLEENTVNAAIDEEVSAKADNAEDTDDETEISEDDEISDDEWFEEDTKKRKDGKLKALFKSRKLRKGGLSIAFTAVFIVLVIVVNMVANLITSKVPALTFDLSASQTYNLTQDTIDFLATVDKDVTITVLASESDYTSASEYYLKANTLLKQYKNFSNKIKIEYVDLTANPTYINNYPDDTLSGGNYIVKCGEKYRILTTNDLFETSVNDYYETEVTGLNVEPAVTTAILNVTSENQTKVQFIDGFGDYEASAFKNLLEQNNYDISTVSTLTEDIDSDTEALILFTPSADLDETSAKKIKEFLNNSGNYGKDLIYVAAPEKIETPNLDALLEEWGMKKGDGVVAETDTSKLLNTSSYLISVLDYNNAEYTDGLKDSTLPLVGGYTVPIEITNENTATSLLTTSESAKLYPFDADESFDIEAAEAQQFNAAAIGTMTSGDDVSSNIAAFGSYLIFDENAIKMSSYNNGAYLVNVCNKLTENTDEGITIDGKDLTQPSLGITTDQINIWTTICMGAIPVVIIIVAIIIWVRRRNR